MSVKKCRLFVLWKLAYHRSLEAQGIDPRAKFAVVDEATPEVRAASKAAEAFFKA